MKNLACTLWVILFTALTACGGESPTPAPTVAPTSTPTEPPPFELSCRGWQSLDSGTTASFRGLSAVSDQVVWVSGTGGTVGRTLDSGATWTMRSVPGATELDFRDVDAFDAETAYLMSAGPGKASSIYKTTDGGVTWDQQWTNPGPEGFFDGMAFWDAERGVLYGDPVDSRFVVLTTQDGGSSWNRVSADTMPEALPEEAGFAASGTGIAVAAGGHAWFGTGGPEARVFHSADYGRTWTVSDTPMQSGVGSAGIFSLTFHDANRGIAVGGDYTKPEDAQGHAARSDDGGNTWTLMTTSAPAGYRSAVAIVPGSQGRGLVTVGISGSDLSLDGGETWHPLGNEEYNSVAFGESPCAGWAAGPDGKIARLAG